MVKVDPPKGAKRPGKNRKYPGVLNVPIERFDPASKSYNAQEEQAYFRACNKERLIALFKFYQIQIPESEISKIEGNPWAILAVHLAITHVPGFEKKAPGYKGRGAPTVWNNALAQLLVYEIDRRLYNAKPQTIQQACISLAKIEPFKDMPKVTPAGLRRRYYELKDNSLLLQSRRGAYMHFKKSVDEGKMSAAQLDEMFKGSDKTRGFDEIMNLPLKRSRPSAKK